jgi:hypothetical protein
MALNDEWTVDPPLLNHDTPGRLAKLPGMVGSARDGEALNAARMADKLVRDCSWFDALMVTAHAPRDPLGGWPGGWRRAVTTCLRCGEDVLSGWERQFCLTLATYAGDCSGKQRVILRRLLDKVVLAGGVP